MNILIKSKTDRWSNVPLVTSGKETAGTTANGAKMRLEKLNRLTS